MCGIYGITGNTEAEGKILDALEFLEYRGYDSAGIAIVAEDGTAKVTKCAGRVRDLRKMCEAKNNSELSKNQLASEQSSLQKATCGIGHTRWATHGGVSDENAHPHQVGKVTIVHNGIIENYCELCEEFHLHESLKSETDTEIVAAVLNHYYQGDPYEAIRKTVNSLKGTFALVMLFADQPGKIYAVRNVSPIVATLCEQGAILASDVAVLSKYNREYFVVPEYHILTMEKEKLTLEDLDGNQVEPDMIKVDWDIESSGKGKYPFFMEKEIMEQPDVIRKTLDGRIVDGLPDLTNDGIPDDLFLGCNRICVVACGTAMHAGLVAQSLVRSRLHMQMDVEMASEFMYNDPVLDEKTLVIAVSQSGETIDTLEALKYAKRHHAKTLAVINVKGATIARESDYALYTCAGPEIAVASTKAFTTQIAAMYLLIARIGLVRGIQTPEQTKAFIQELMKVPDSVKIVLDKRMQMHNIAGNMLQAQDVFMIGRGLDYKTLLEGSLKLKEISYIHCEACASGELKHGTIALITNETPVVAVVTQTHLVEKELSNIREVSARGAKILLLTRESMQLSQTLAWSGVFTLPDLSDEMMVFPATIALQLLAYYVSSDKGLDVDKPRNLAKVVTVE